MSRVVQGHIIVKTEFWSQSAGHDMCLAVASFMRLGRNRVLARLPANRTIKPMFQMKIGLAGNRKGLE